MQAVILAAGRGSRMFPYDRYWQKACLPIANKPNIRILCENLFSPVISDISVVVSYQESCVRNALAGLNVRYFNSGNLPQTLYELCRSDDTLIVYGDVMINWDDLAVLSLEDGCAALIESDWAKFQKRDWICATADGGQILSFWGHPRETYGNARSAGAFLLPASSAKLLIEGPAHFSHVPSGGMPMIGFSVEQCLQAAIERGQRVASCYASRPVVDLDYPWNLMEANRIRCEALCGAVKETEIGENCTVDESVKLDRVCLGDRVSIGQGVIFEGPCIVGDGTEIRNGAIIGANTVIGSDCLIENYCKIADGTAVGNGCRIGFTAELSGVIMDSVSAVHGCELFGVIGQGADIGASTTVGFLQRR